MSTRRLALALVILVVAALFFLQPLLGVLVDWWWFQEIGYQIVFTRELVTQVLLFLIVGGLVGGTLYLNLRLAQRGLVPYPVVLRFAQGPRRVGITTPLRRLSLPVSLVLGTLAGLGATSAWNLVLQFLYRTPFGIKDPIFFRDVGFYVFTLPALSALLGLLYALAMVSFLMLIPVYALRGDIVVRPRRVAIEPAAGLHLAVLLALLFLLVRPEGLFGERRIDRV